jgi:hypothetical protein
MSKQRFKSLRKYEYDDEIEEDTRLVRDKRKERRFDRALRVKSIEDLKDLDDEGIDPIDYDEDVVENEEEDYRAYLQIQK